MDVQTLVLWAARLACPLMIGAFLWFMLRQSSTGPDPSPERHLADLRKRRAAVEHQIQVLEGQVGQSETIGEPALPEAP